MANYNRVLRIPVPLAQTFAFVSDFRNAAGWDPRTYSAEITTDGPIGLGTTFVLTGSAVPQHVARRLRLPEAVVGMKLPYTVVEFEPARRFVLEGESGMVRYRDVLDFAADESDTVLDYSADLVLKGVPSVGDVLLSGLFQQIGDDATDGIPSAVARSVE